jgi:hypothetical protein
MSDWNNVARGMVSTGFAPPNEITVLFDDSTITFPMPAAATLADIAGRLTDAGVPQRRQMLALTIKLGGAQSLRSQSWPRVGNSGPSYSRASRAAKCQLRDEPSNAF